jgi:hypothetical protein
MKTIFLIFFVFFTSSVILSSCSEQELKIRERPENIIPSSIRAETLQNIQNLFPEFENQRLKKPGLFEFTAEKRIVLSQASEVYLTFVSEGTGYQNSLGYYVYNSNSIPLSASQIELNMLFPNVSNQILKQGDKLQVGNIVFPAGSVIGFFLIIDGWQNGVLQYDREKIYTDQIFNASGFQQHILFKQGSFGDIILGFEDATATNPGISDNDFNDIIFTVTDNKLNKEIVNFNTTNVVKL